MSKDTADSDHRKWSLPEGAPLVSYNTKCECCLGMLTAAAGVLAESAALRARVEVLEGALKKAQWGSCDGCNQHQYCPECHQGDPKQYYAYDGDDEYRTSFGHKPDCSIGVALNQSPPLSAERADGSARGAGPAMAGPANCAAGATAGENPAGGVETFIHLPPMTIDQLAQHDICVCGIVDGPHRHMRGDK